MLTQLERDQLMLKIESARNGKSWDAIENADLSQVSEVTFICSIKIYIHLVIKSYYNFFFLIRTWTL
jgi:hypothetical protein